jgi:hypothetical protein
MKLKGKVLKTCVRTIMVLGSETWVRMTEESAERSVVCRTNGAK